MSSPLLNTVLSKVIALMFREASMASLSARVESSFDASCNAYFLYGLHHFVFYLMSFRKNPLSRDITYLCREYDAHVTLVHIHSTQVWSVEGGALEVIVLLIFFYLVLLWMLTSSTDIFGKFRRVSHSLLRYSTAPTMTTCLSSW